MRFATGALLTLMICLAIVALRADVDPRRPAPAPAKAATGAESAFARAADVAGAKRRYTLPPDRTRARHAYRPHPDDTPREARARRWEAGLARFLHERR